MDVATANRIYDEIAATVGRRLIDLGASLEGDSLDTLSTDREWESGVDPACALGRLYLDSGDISSVVLAIEAQDDRIRSLLSLPMKIEHFVDLQDARLRRQLMAAFVRNDQDGMASAFQEICSLPVL